MIRIRKAISFLLNPPQPRPYKTSAYLLEGQAEGVNSGEKFQKDLRHRLDVAEEKQHCCRLGQSPKASVVDSLMTC